MMDVEVLAAIVAGLLSLIATAISIAATRSNAKLTARLDQENATANARRGYEYDALRRLYAEFEPLRFQLIESANNAIDFIERIAFLSKALEPPGSLPGGNYQQLSRIYHLLLPSVVFRILRRRLTLVDMQISTEVRLSYQIAKQVYLSFTQDAEVAKLSNISYTPYVEGWREKRIQDPHRFRRQGLPLGRLDNALDALTTPVENGHERPLTFGEFEQLFEGVEPHDYRGPLGATRDLFEDFEIASRPVLWRLLVTQYFLYDLLVFLQDFDNPQFSDVVARVNKTSQDAKRSILDAELGDDYIRPTEVASFYLRDFFFPEAKRILSGN
jgi:hypothetical protein